MILGTLREIFNFNLNGKNGLTYDYWGMTGISKQGPYASSTHLKPMS